MFAQKSVHTTQKGPIMHGLRDGIPIAMGYMAVAFSLGIIAAKAGLSAPEGFLSSFFTRASAGEYGTYTLVAVQAAYAEVIAMCLVVNLRYMLMSAALSQKIAPGTSWVHRLLMACCVTDEIFGISIAHPGYTPPAYTYLGLCDRHRGRQSVAPADGDGPEHVALRHVPGNHHSRGPQRQECALCADSEFCDERPVCCGACGGTVEQRHADGSADDCDFSRFRMA